MQHLGCVNAPDSIVKLHDVMEDPRSVFMILELCRGCNVQGER